MSDLEELELFDDIDYDDIEQPKSLQTSKPQTTKQLNEFETIFGDGDISDEKITTVFEHLLSGERENLLTCYLGDFLTRRLHPNYRGSPIVLRYTPHDIAETLAESILAEREWSVASVVEEVLTEPERLLHLWLPRLYRWPLESLKRDQHLGAETIFECPILCVEETLDRCIVLPCGHMYSVLAYRGLLESMSKDKKLLLSVTCMSDQCGLPVPYRLMRDLMAPEALERLTMWRKERFMGAYGIFKCGAKRGDTWCQRYIKGLTEAGARSCETRKNLLDTRKAEVSCPAGHVRCGMCHMISHCPFPCKYIVAWDSKHQDDSANLQWKLANTKSCPKCGHDIEKNSGCMHITCCCRFEFCWLCQKEWRNHSSMYHPDCTTFKFGSTKGVDPNSAAEKSKYELERYQFYANRYDAHFASAQIIVDVQIPGLALVIAANRLCVRIDVPSKICYHCSLTAELGKQ
eukprot:GHVH01006130.1.p1 GENE.GHVH01006130.1~~GHVH01006130.1.p1  ORF type:complete len:461 (+),score=53.06 GHVH01006130.1:1851-3233(+)